MYSVFKRIFDFIIALISILILSPALIPVIIGLSLTGEGHVWYFQDRVGKKNIGYFSGLPKISNAFASFSEETMTGSNLFSSKKPIAISLK